MAEYLENYGQSTIAEMNDGIILAKFEKSRIGRETAYQSEADLESHLIRNLRDQGYELLEIGSAEDLYKNLKLQIEKLNRVSFTEEEWERFLKEYLDAPNDGMIEKTRKILNGMDKTKNIAVFIGPEGGFEEEEVEKINKSGFEVITLGKRILRTETAGLALLSNIMIRLEDE